MANGNTLHILNQFDYAITVYVSQNNWNCCDAPAPGQAVGHIAPGGTIDLGYCRKDGHGCDGCQGQFQLDINIAMNVPLNFDSDGNMGTVGATNGCNAAMSQRPDGTYQLIVYAS